MRPERESELDLFRPLTPMACYAVLGVAPTTPEDEVERRFASRYRAARRDPAAPYSQSELNDARRFFTESGPRGERLFWTFPITGGAAPALGPENAPPPAYEALKAAILEADAPWT